LKENLKFLAQKFENSKKKTKRSEAKKHEAELRVKFYNFLKISTKNFQKFSPVFPKF